MLLKNSYFFILLSLIISGCASVAPENRVAVPEGIDGTKANYAVAQAESDYLAGNMDQALAGYLSALEYDDQNVEALYKIGSIQNSKNNHISAERAFHQAIKVDKKHVGALEGLGLLLIRKESYSDAKKYLRSALQQEPDRWKTNVGLGIIADQEKNHVGAEKFFQTALRSKPNSPIILTNLGFSNYKSGNYSQAESYYHKALTIDPEYRKAWSNLGLLFVKQEKYENAIKSFQKTMNRAKAVNNVGYLCMNEGRYGRAQIYFEEAIRLSPAHFPEAQKNLQEVKRRAAFE